MKKKTKERINKNRIMAAYINKSVEVYLKKKLKIKRVNKKLKNCIKISNLFIKCRKSFQEVK